MGTYFTFRWKALLEMYRKISPPPLQNKKDKTETNITIKIKGRTQNNPGKQPLNKIHF